MTIIATNLSNLIDEDLESLYIYLKHAPSISGVLDQERQRYTRYCVSDADCNTGESSSPPASAPAAPAAATSTAMPARPARTTSAPLQ